MFVTESIAINLETSNITLEDLIKINHLYAGYNNIIHRKTMILKIVIILKKVSDYLKQYQDSLLYTITIGEIIKRIEELCEMMRYHENNSDIRNKFNIFIDKFDESINRGMIFVLFYANEAIKKLESELTNG